MKTMTLILLLAICALPAYPQNITNTLGVGGVFTIKDASNNYLTVSQSTGQVDILNALRLENTTSSSVGILFKGTDRFLHNYAAPGTNGCNTFLGILSGNFAMTGSGTQCSYNTAIGNASLYANTTGSENTGVGHGSLYTNASGAYNTALGTASLFLNTTGANNTAVGRSSLYHNTTGEYNTALGCVSSYYNTTGSRNTAVGYGSLYTNTTGNFNTAVGYASLTFNTTGFSNTAMGYSSLYTNSTGYDNTAVGDSSLYSNTTGFDNTAVGYSSLYSNTTGANNTAVGIYSLHGNTTGEFNTAVGRSSLYDNTTGAFNTALGFATLAYNKTGGLNTIVGALAGGSFNLGQNNTIIGYNAQPSSADVSNQITLGNSSVTSLRCQVTSITALSDARDKKNINDLSLGIDFLMKLKPRLFNWDKREWYEDNKSDGSKMQKTPTAGFIAQELDEVQTKENAEWLDLVLKNNPEKLETTPGNLLPVMVKAIQELKAENNALKDKLEKFERIQTVLVSEIEKLKSKDVELTQVRNGN